MSATVIFDLDGLLADTEKLHFEAYRQTLAEVGVTIDEELYSAHWIRDGRGIVEFCATRGLAQSPQALRSRKAIAYDALVRASVTPMPGALELLAALRGRRRLGLATSAFADAARCVLETLAIESSFEVIATGEDVARLKPHPDLFLFVAGKLGVRPADCVVLEDAEKGVRAAHAAGMAVVAIPNVHTRANDFSLATRVLPSLHDVDLALLDSLVAGAAIA